MDRLKLDRAEYTSWSTSKAILPAAKVATLGVSAVMGIHALNPYENLFADMQRFCMVGFFEFQQKKTAYTMFVILGSRYKKNFEIFVHQYMRALE